MTDRDVVERVAVMMGKSVTHVDARSERAQDTYQVNVMGWPAIDIMQAIRPLMGARRGAKIDELIAGYDGERRDGRTHCQRGHEFTSENTYTHGGTRRCRECHRRWRAKVM